MMSDMFAVLCVMYLLQVACRRCRRRRQRRPPASRTPRRRGTLQMCARTHSSLQARAWNSLADVLPSPLWLCGMSVAVRLTKSLCRGAGSCGGIVLCGVWRGVVCLRSCVSFRLAVARACVPSLYPERKDAAQQQQQQKEPRRAPPGPDPGPEPDADAGGGAGGSAGTARRRWGKGQAEAAGLDRRAAEPLPARVRTFSVSSQISTVLFIRINQC